MNQAFIFNDDLSFNNEEDAWCLTAQLSGQLITIYYHSFELKQLDSIDTCTKYDLEEVAELWLEKNDIEENIIHINLK
ncbi:hypothetical protein [Colwellia sp. RSH04]|uniref:hypothetical protein n=1 Tax=Colwellia sp. RSH04 TaxID=2305464 RepID=UPI000E5857B0|nr:hypothetical protein [Colwellia sp. RSH04]RHW76547.1 hypothetical protein D1094_09600 [Colwellia sp. RSH04]